MSLEACYGVLELRVARTINELVDQHEVVLDCLLVNFPEVRLGDGNESVAELEDKGRIGIAPEGIVHTECMYERERLTLLLLQCIGCSRAHGRSW